MITRSGAAAISHGASPPTRPSVGLLVTLGTAGVLLTVAQLVGPFVSWQDGPVDVPMLLVVSLSVSSFAFLGLFAFAKRPDNRVGPLMMGVAFAAWLGLIGWIATPATYTIGVFLFQDLWLAVLGHLFLAFPTGRLGSRFDRRLVICGYVWWFGSEMLTLAFLDFRANGWVFDNIFLIRSDNGLAEAIDQTNAVITAGLALVYLYALTRHWRQASPAGRRVLAPVLWASVPTATAIVFRIAGDTLRIEPVGEIVDGPWGVLALSTLPIGFAVGLLRSRFGRSKVGDLVVELGEAPESGRVRDTLVRILHDPSLRIAYRLPESGTYVDETGRPVSVDNDSTRAITPVERGGEPIAALVHDPAVLQDPDLLRSAVAAARLAVENERLQAEVRAQLEEVRASRARIVEAGDVERRRVERDLHDGAQQRLVTLALQLRWIHDRAAEDADPSIATSIDEVAAELRNAIDELRDLARGIHPAILTEEGLGAAVESLAERSAVPVAIERSDTGRFPEAVEATAYFVVAEALANVVKYAPDSHARIRISDADDVLEVEVSDDGAGGADVHLGTGLRGLADRVAALGGRLTVESPLGCGTIVRAEVPSDGR